MKTHKKEILALIFGVFMVLLTAQAALALPSLSVTMPGEVTAFLNEDTFFNMTVKNTGDQTLYNLTFSDIRATHFPEVQNLTPGQERNLSVRITPGGAFTQDFVITSEFLYIIEEAPTPKTVDVSISTDKFTPDDVDLFVNDTIRFSNGAGATAVVKEFNDTFVLTIPPASSQTYQFLTEGSFKPFHEAKGFTMNVVVASGTLGSLAHSNDLDVQTSFRIIAKEKPGSLTINVLTNDLKLNYDGTGEGVIDIRNTGTGLVRDITLDAEKWIEFLDNRFDLNPGQNRIIRFNVTPQNITKTNQTNISYSIKVDVDVDNDEDRTFNIPIFINFHDFKEIKAGNNTFVIEQLDPEGSIALCNAIPDYPGCDKLIQIKEVERVIEKNKTIGLTEQEIKNYQEQAAKVGEASDRIENKFNAISEDVNDLNGRQNQMDDNIKELLDGWTAMQKSIEDDTRSRKIRNIVTFIIVVLIICGIVGYVAYREYDYKERVHKHLYGEE